MNVWWRRRGRGRTFLVAVHGRSADSNTPHKTVDSAGYHHNYITGIWSLSPLLDIKIVRLVDRSDLFKISNLVGKIVSSLYSSLREQKQLMAGIVS